VTTEFQYRLRNNKGEYRWFHTYGTIFSRDKQDQVEYVLNISMDVTNQYLLAKQLKEEKALAESKSEELRQSEERFHQMIAEVEDYAILLLDKNGIIQNWNKGAEKIKGYKAEEIIGKSFQIFYPKEAKENNKPDKLLRQAIDTGKSTDEGWRVRKNGTRFWSSTTITALHDQNNNVIGFTKVTRDLTERKKAEDKLYKYAKQLEEKNEELKRTNKELESFNYVASHDLQEPLRKIQVFSNAILSSEMNALSEKGKEYFIRMNSAANRMKRLIEDLLIFSRTTVTNAVFEYCDLNIMLEEVLSTLKFSIDETNAIIESEKLPVAYIIPFQFRQVFQNLISNSIKYRKPEIAPHIKITAKESERKNK
jgi:PAS domain S-box-containing protein